MVRFIDTENDTKLCSYGCKEADFIHANLHPEDRTRFLMNLLLCGGSLCYHQLYDMGLFSEGYSNFKTDNAKKFIAYYTKKGFLLCGQPLNERSHQYIISLSASGMQQLLTDLSDLGILTKELETVLTTLFKKRKRWRPVKNIEHYNGISSFCASFLSLGGSSLLFRELSILPSVKVNRVKTPYYFTAPDIPQFRCDAYARYEYHPQNPSAEDFLKDASQVLDSTERCTHIFYEQDTGSQNGTVITSKLENYISFFSQLRWDFELHLPEQDKREGRGGTPGIMLLFGILMDTPVRKKTSYKQTLLLHQNSKGYRTLRALELLSMLADALSIKELLIRMNSLPADTLGYDLALAGSLIRENYEEYVRYFDISSDTTGKNTRNTAEESDLPAMPYIKYLCDTFCESKKDSLKDTSSMPGSPFSADTAAVPNMDGFFTRRNFLFKKIREQVSRDEFLRGNRYCVAPTHELRYMLPFLLADTTYFRSLLPEILAANLIPMEKEISFSPVFPITPHHIGVNVYTCGFMEKEFRVSIENFSADASAQDRIIAIMDENTDKNRGTDTHVYDIADIPFFILCLFLRKDLSSIREFATTSLPLLPAGSSAAYGKIPQNSILFLCMEDLLSHNCSGICFTKNGRGCYRLFLDKDTSRVFYPNLAPDATDTGEALFSETLPDS